MGCEDPTAMKNKKGPCTVERTDRRVIEKRLLDGLSDGEHVAILASKQDLNLLIDALRNIAPNWDCKVTGFLKGLEQLRNEAFPK
jgi:hypothetical protein